MSRLIWMWVVIAAFAVLALNIFVGEPLWLRGLVDLVLTVNVGVVVVDLFKAAWHLAGQLDERRERRASQ